MPRANPIQTNFTGGEVSPYLYSRVDTAKYQNGCKTLENFVVTSTGAAKKRTGSKFVWYSKENLGTTRLVRFNYNAEQSYMLEIGNLYIRFFTNGGILTQTPQTISGITNANPAVVTYVGADTYANGDSIAIGSVAGMTEINNREFTVAGLNAGANTFQLSGVNSTTYGIYAGGGTASEIIEVVTTYTSAELADLSFCQSADTLFIAHPDHALAKLVRTSSVAWTLSDVSVLRGPWRTLNSDQTITIKANDITGTVTLESSAAVFDALHVGAKFKLYTSSRTNGESEFGSTTGVAALEYWSFNGQVYYIPTIAGGSASSDKFNPPTHKTGTVRLYASGATTQYADATFVHQGFGIVTIATYASATGATAAVYAGYGYQELPLQIADSAMAGGLATNARFSAATPFWQEGAWSNYRGFAEKITFFEQRLIATQVQTVYGSVSGNFSDFEEGVNDDQALNYTLASEQVDVIRWINPGKQLLIGTTGGEYVMGATSLNEATTPKNVKISRETSFGSSPCNEVRIGNAVLFMQRRGDPDNPGRKMREMAYNFDIDGYASNDLTIFAPHITGEGVTRLTYQADPDNIVWGAKTDGGMCALTYQREHEVTAWHRHILGGFADANVTPAKVEDVETMPGTNGDEVWMIAQRYIAGSVVRYIEVLSYFDDVLTLPDAIYVDSALTSTTMVTPSGNTAITGLWHLRNQIVKYLAAGVIGSGTVNSVGLLNVTVASSTQTNIGFGYTAKLETLDIEAGAAAGTAQGRQKRVSAVTLRLQRSCGGEVGSATANDAISYSDQTDPLAMFTGDRVVVMPTGWAATASVYVEHSDPTPFTVLGLIHEISTTG